MAGHGSRVLLVSGGTWFDESPRRAQLEAGLAAAGVELVGTATVAGEPGPADVEGPLARHREAGVDVVLGIGGGAVLDTAKAIAGLLRSGTSLMDHLEGVGRGLPYPGPALPVVAVPTTAGTGSEATRNAVITERGPQGYKRSFRDERLVPADAVVDPDLLATAPRPLIAANGLDALTQLLEAYTSQRATPFTDALARSGLAAVREGLLAWHADPAGPGAPAARSQMAYAALLSGICLANAGLGAVHGLASPLGAQLPIPHGMACGSVLWQTIDGQHRGPGGARTGRTGPGPLRGCRTHPGRPARRLRHDEARCGAHGDTARLGGTPGGPRAVGLRHGPRAHRRGRRRFAGQQHADEPRRAHGRGAHEHPRARPVGSPVRPGECGAVPERMVMGALDDVAIARSARPSASVGHAVVLDEGTGPEASTTGPGMNRDPTRSTWCRTDPCIGVCVTRRVVAIPESRVE